MGTLNKIKNEIKRYRKGVMTGLAVGFIATYYVSQQGVSFMFAVEQHGLLDRTALAATPETLAFVKVALVFMTLGAFAGYFIEKNFMR